MDYVEVQFSIQPYSSDVAEILIANLAQIQFESFVEENDFLMAYVPKLNFNHESIKECIAFISDKSINVSFSYKIIPQKNWNEVWESNFNPITIENLCRIRAPFHPVEEGYNLELVIEPKMAFGTGHHQTTWLMARELFSMDLKGKTVLDMGCGTGILAIIAEKLGAQMVVAIDNDEWAYTNTLENAEKNGCNRIHAKLGNAKLLDSPIFNVILANINLNILIADMRAYYHALLSGGLILFSGILIDDIDKLRTAAEKEGLQFISSKFRDNWAMVIFSK